MTARFVLALVSSAAAGFVDLDLWTAGEGGYVCYRLPNLVELNTAGHLVAFGQGRKGAGCPDGGPMDSLVRRSYDNGATWTAQQLVYANAAQQTMGTPTAIHDPQTDSLFLFMNPQHAGRDAADGRRVLLFNSTDGGATWSAPRDMTTALVPAGWDNVWMGTQQGLALTLGGGGSDGSNRRSRLIMCANHHGSGPGGSNGAHTVYSDDGGATWRNGATLDLGSEGLGDGIGECALAQAAAGGAVTMYGRVVYDNASAIASRRMLAFSADGGTSFGLATATTGAFPGNPGADAEGAFVQHGGTFVVGSPWGAVGPANPGRHNYTLLASRAGDDGRPSKTWSAVRVLAPGVEAQYSTMAVSRADGGRSLFVVYERGNMYGNEPTQPKESLRLTQVPFPALA